MGSYTVTSPEGAAKAGQLLGAEEGSVNVGDVVDLELDVNQEIALLAAGWLETTNNKRRN